MTYYVGIDLGRKGALAILSDKTVVDIVDFDAQPLEVQAGLIRRRLEPLRSMVAEVLMEQVHAMPPVLSGKRAGGSVANFQLGRASGLVEGILLGLTVPYRTVAPARWKRHFGLIGQDKGASRARASQLVPEQSFARVKDDGRADACLLAIYARDTYRREEPS